MLRVTPSLDLLHHEIRRRVCAHCYRRPPHSESLGPEVVRSCELTCPVFVHLPMLRKTAMLLDPMLGSRREAMKHRIAEVLSNESPTENTDPGAPRSQPPAEDPPLRRYREDVVNTVLELVGET